MNHKCCQPNHPNYFLGAEAGSICDSLTVGLNELSNTTINLKVYPNPVIDNRFTITYLLEKNKKGLLEVFDVEGRVVYKQLLPQWSTMQNVTVSVLHSGIYLLRLTSGENIVATKMVVQ